jgi:hypothetical protein
MSRSLIAVIVLIGLLACSRPVPSGEPLPSRGQPEVGVGYRITVFCPAPIEVGNSVWLFTGHESWPPDKPHGPFDSVVSPYPVPGLLTLTSRTEAVFRADIDGSELRLSRGHRRDLGDACL